MRGGVSFLKALAWKGGELKRNLVRNVLCFCKLDNDCRLETSCFYIYSMLWYFVQLFLNFVIISISACQQVNYPGGLQVHTEMVIRGNFSEIGSFMPGLKTLMQIAGQLGV